MWFTIKNEESDNKLEIHRGEDGTAYICVVDSTDLVLDTFVTDADTFIKGVGVVLA